MFLLVFLAATMKDDDYIRELHRYRRCTALIWLREIFYDSSYRFFLSIGNGRNLFCFLRAGREGAGSKIEYIELCNAHFGCAFIFCQPMKTFEFNFLVSSDEYH